MLEDTFLSDLYNVTSYSYNDFHKMEVVEYFCIPVFDMDYFEEFLQKNCPIAYGLVDTYILLKELQELTPTTKVL